MKQQKTKGMEEGKSRLQKINQRRRKDDDY